VLFKCGEEMDVVGHDDVAPNEDASCGSGFGEKAKSLVKKRLGKQGQAVVGTEGEKIEELIGINSVEPGETRGLHGKRRRS
jgi:hypothetical protein